MGSIIKVYPGSMPTVKTTYGVMERMKNRLCVLPIEVKQSSELIETYSKSIVNDLKKVCSDCGIHFLICSIMYHILTSIVSVLIDYCTIVLYLL